MLAVQVNDLSLPHSFFSTSPLHASFFVYSPFFSSVSLFLPFSISILLCSHIRFHPPHFYALPTFPHLYYDSILTNFFLSHSLLRILYLLYCVTILFFFSRLVLHFPSLFSFLLLYIIYDFLIKSWQIVIMLLTAFYPNSSFFFNPPFVNIVHFLLI